MFFPTFEHQTDKKNYWKQMKTCITFVIFAFFPHFYFSGIIFTFFLYFLHRMTKHQWGLDLKPSGCYTAIIYNCYDYYYYYYKSFNNSFVHLVAHAIFYDSRILLLSSSERYIQNMKCFEIARTLKKNLWWFFLNIAINRISVEYSTVQYFFFHHWESSTIYFEQCISV